MHDEFEVGGDRCSVELVHPDVFIVLAGEKVASIGEDDFTALLDRQSLVLNKFVVENVHHAHFVAKANDEVSAAWVESKSVSFEVTLHAQLVLKGRVACSIRP